MKNQLVKKITGVLLILAGLLILLTPLTPGSWIIFIGFELLGIRMTFWKKLKSWFETYRPSKKSLQEDKKF